MLKPQNSLNIHPTRSPLDFSRIKYLILLLTRRCNLRCSYCYNGDEIEADMSRGQLAQIFELISPGKGPIHIQLTGGEPTLVPELIEQAVFWALDLKKKSGRPTTLALQTNGTLITPELARNFRTWGLEVGVSLDGPPDVNELTRGGSRDLMRGLEILGDQGVPFRVTTVVSKQNALRLHEVPLFLASNPASRGMGLDLLTQKGRGGTPASPGELQMGVKKLKETLGLVNRFRQSPFVLRELEKVNSAKNGKFCEIFCEAHRGLSLAVTPTGQMYPCGQAVGENAFCLGTLGEPRRPSKNLHGVKLKNPDCKNCPLQGFCPGDCPGRLFYNSLEEQILVCNLYQTLFAA
ncbi:MAG: radical SAM protein [Deltaproteobacteria bacterium]|jgi:uncharacterized protein|nr:radical SAM protein [Deltaproteobacteria bacterium]